MTSTTPRRWRFYIDRGGTFTDIVAQRPDGTLVSRKVLSVDPASGVDPTLRGIASMLGLKDGRAIPSDIIEIVRLGTTIGTNALLERRGEPTVLVTTSGFADVLRIGYQTRPDIFARRITLPEPLYSEVIEVAGRVASDGTELEPLDTEGAERALRECRSRGITSCAISLMNSYRNPSHERELGELARRLGFEHVAVGHELGALIGFVGRGDTAVVDAYVSPAVRAYVSEVARRAGPMQFYCMKSDGGLAPASAFRGKDAVLSGPAGGVTACIRTARDAGFERIIGFDMGGTSTDVCHYAGAVERSYEAELDGIRLRTPMLEVHTIAAGGGSIVRFEDGRIQVGPQSAGASPGPACYGRGGPLTVTDCNLLLGRLPITALPAVFGPDGTAPPDIGVVREQFAALAARVTAATGEAWTPERIATGALQIAVHAMARAVAKLTVDRGHDVRKHVLNCFGGAGGQHACGVADALGIPTVLVHPYAGALSAYGMALADITARREATVDRPLDASDLKAALDIAASLRAEAALELSSQELQVDPAQVGLEIHLRYRGSATTHIVPLSDLDGMVSAFEDAHRKHYGFVSTEQAIVIDRVAVELRAAAHSDIHSAVIERNPGALDSDGTVPAFVDGAWTRVPRVSRHLLVPGVQMAGPSIVTERMSTIVIDAGWVAAVDPRGNLVLRRVDAAGSREVGTQRDPVRLELFDNVFMSVAEQMGAVLRKSAVSTNIRERLDFSCAIFDVTGALIANAPHMPVHLGSMSASVQVVVAASASVRPGDVYMLNDPYRGGTHLPDVTVVTPVYAAESAEPFCYVASRAHHADIGGITPGSMPSSSRRIEEEGVLIPLFKLVDATTGFRRQAVHEILASGRYPARNISQNIADLQAQVAANEKGVAEIGRLVTECGTDVVTAYMGHVQDLAEELTRAAISRLRNGESSVEMDDGSIVRVAISVDAERGKAVLDFTGTSTQRETNYNAPVSIVRAAAMYVFRCLLDRPIALNEGMARPLEIRLPQRSMLSPEYPAAVVAGNVEVSQAVVDALNGALGVLAPSQGTMNNLTFGNERHQYYETICGGAGAGPEFHGASAVHTHMTNSRLTDPEILEARLPVLLEEFRIRRGSGGTGRWCGGDGVVRTLRFGDEMTVSLLGNRHRVPPKGAAGGGDGAPGAARLTRCDGSVETLGSRFTTSVVPGESLTIMTPGAAAYGGAE